MTHSTQTTDQRKAKQQLSSPTMLDRITKHNNKTANSPKHGHTKYTTGGGGLNLEKYITKTCLFKYIENCTTKTWKFSDKYSDIFHVSAQNIYCWYSLEPHRQGGSNKYPQSMFLSSNKKIKVYPCKPQFYDINMGFKGVKLYRHVFVMTPRGKVNNSLPQQSYIGPLNTTIRQRIVQNMIIEPQRIGTRPCKVYDRLLWLKSWNI